DDQHHGRGENGAERRHPRHPVEAPERGRREHLLAVARGERGQHLILRLAASEAIGDLALHGLAGGTVQVIAGMDGEPAAALTGERLLDLLLGRLGCRRARRQRDRQQQRRRCARGRHSAAACAAPGASTRTSRSAAAGHTATAVPRARMSPPSQIHTTSGFTYAWMVASCVFGSYDPSTTYRSSRSVERLATSVVGCFGFL